MRPSRRRISLPLAVVVLLFTIAAISRAQAQAPAQTAPNSTAQIPAAKSGVGAEWESKLGELADKVATAVPSGGVDLVVNNMSSLDADHVAAIAEALKAKLTDRHIRLVDAPQAEISLQVTLSEGAGGYLLVAQIQRGADEQTAIYPVPKVAAATKPGDGVTLEADLIWQGPTAILDFATVPIPGVEDPELVTLEAGRIVFYTRAGGEWQLHQAVTILPLRPRVRAPRGYIDLSKGTANGIAKVPGVDCGGDFGNPSTIRCSFVIYKLLGSDDSPKSQLADFTVESAGISLECGGRHVVLGTGTGDWTQTDTIQAYEIQAYETGAPGANTPIVSGTPLEVPGPVVSLRASETGGAARAVVHNLRTDAYEAYVITATCGR